MTAAGTSGTGPGRGSAAGGALGRAPSQPGARCPRRSPPGGIPAGSPALPRGVGGSGARVPSPVRLSQAGTRSRHGSYLGSGRHKASCTGELGEVPGTGTVWGGHSAAPSSSPTSAGLRHLHISLPAWQLFAFRPSSSTGHLLGAAPCPVCSPLPPPPLQRLLFIWAILFCCDPILYFFFLFHGPELETMGCSRCWRRGGCSQRGSALAPVPCPLACSCRLGIAR